MSKKKPWLSEEAFALKTAREERERAPRRGRERTAWLTKGEEVLVRSSGETGKVVRVNVRSKRVYIKLDDGNTIQAPRDEVEVVP